MRKQNNFKKGAVEMLLLQILSTKGDCYGYELSQILKDTENEILAIPEGSLYPALYKLIEKGYKVAICEQVEDAKNAKGLVKREVTRVVTPGTNLNACALDEGKNNYIMVRAKSADFLF